MFFCVILLGVTLALYLWQRLKYKTFERDGVPFVFPAPFLGNFWRSNLRRRHLIYDLVLFYSSFPKANFMGVYQFTLPIIMLRDPEIIKQVTVKDFDHFTDHEAIVDEHVEPLFGRNLLSLKGQKWKDMRSTLSPAFTSAKIRNMCGFISECGQQMITYLEGRCSGGAQKDGKASVDLEIKDLCTRYMNDVIATTAFGLKVDSFKDQNNEFYRIGKRATNVQGAAYLRLMVILFAPKIGKFFNVRIFPEEVSNFYERLVTDNINQRDAEGIYRPDMIHLLNEAKKGRLKHDGENDKDAGFATVQESEIGTADNKRQWENKDLVAQALLFFLAGFDTTATVVSFLLYELAINPHVQRKLQEEIDVNIAKHGVNATYDVIQHLKYCDMVISETLRKWPASSLVDRKCTKDCDLGPPSNTCLGRYKIKKGQCIWIPIYALHHDPKYWKNPEHFDPERFSDENKHDINAFAYLPFGAGPRNCIGSRFALMEAKIMLYHLIGQFDIRVNSQTQIPLKLASNTFNMRAENGLCLSLILRKTKSD